MNDRRCWLQSIIAQAWEKGDRSGEWRGMKGKTEEAYHPPYVLLVVENALQYLSSTTPYYCSTILSTVYRSAVAVFLPCILQYMCDIGYMYVHTVLVLVVHSSYFIRYQVPGTRHRYSTDSPVRVLVRGHTAYWSKIFYDTLRATSTLNLHSPYAYAYAHTITELCMRRQATRVL